MIFILDKSMNIRDSLSNSGEISHITPFFDDIYTSYLETGAETYQFSTLANTKESQHLIVGNHIAFQYEDEYKLFTITEIEETHDENFIKTVYCEMAGLKLINKVIRPMTFSSTNLRKFLEEILSDTDWNIGALDIGLNNVCDIEIKDYTNAYSLLQTHIRESYKGEIHFTVKFEGSKATKYINVYSNRGQFDGFRFSYDSNLTSITRTINFDDLATALIGVGNNGLTFKEIETEDKPLNQDFITDESAYLLWNDNGSHILGYEKFDTDSPQELLKLTREKLKERCQPKIKYELNPELLGETVKIGDTVYVIDNEFNPPIHLSARINQLSISLTDKSNNSCVLSNFTEITSNITEEMRQIASQLEGYVDGQFPIGGDKIQDGAINGDKLTNGQIIQGTHIFANSITADHIQAETIDTEHLKADSIDAEKIQANSITSNHIQSNTIETEHLKANIIQSEHIQSNTIDANHIISNSINSGHIQTGTITAGSGIIADGAIGNAQISKIDAGKIEAGTIDTSKVTIQGSNGHLRLKGNRIQVFDGVGNQAKERVSVGDVNGDGTRYGLRVRGADGETVLLDENGVTREGITDGSITNDKISDNAGIDGAKLNINSVVSCINEDGTEVIKGTKISVNGTNLETKLSTIENTQTTQGSTISQHSSKILANEKAIALKVDSQTYTTDKNNMTTQLNKNTSAIDVLQDEIALKVEQTDINQAKTELGKVIDSKINTAKAEIKVTTDAITQNVSNLTQTVSNKADGSTVSTLSNKVGSLETSVNGISGKVSSLETSNTTLNNKVNTAQNTANANKTNISSLQTEVSTVKNNVASLDVTTNGISQKVSSLQSTTTTLTNKVNTAQSTADNVNNKLEGIKIGGTNLLKGTKDFSTGKGNATVDTTKYYDFTVLKNNVPSTGYADMCQWTNLAIKPNTEYTLSFYAKASVNGAKHYSYLYPDAVAVGSNSSGATTNAPDGAIITTLTTEWKRYWVTWKTRSTLSGAKNMIPMRILSSLATTGVTTYICGVHFEEGNRSTDWSPAPEDVSQDATNKSNQALTDAKNYTNTQITTVNNKVASIQTDLNGITSRVTNTENNINTINGNVTSLTNRVTTAESKITESAITNTVKKNFYTKTETDSQITSKGYQTASQVQQTVDKLEVKFEQSGGYNLIRNSLAKNGSINWSQATYRGDSSGMTFDYRNDSWTNYTDAIQIRSNTTQTDVDMGYLQKVKVERGKKYTLRCLLAGHRSSKHIMITNANNSASLVTSPTYGDIQGGTSGPWQEVILNFTTTEDYINVRLFFKATRGDAYIWIRELCLIEGELPLKWSPHPSEIYDGITTIDKEGITVKQSNISTYTTMDASSFRVENNTGGTVAEFSQNSQIPNLTAGIITANEVYANNVVRKSTYVKNYYVAGGYGNDKEGAGGSWNNPCKTVQYVLDNYIEDILDYDVNIYVGESVPGWTCKSKSGKGVISFLIENDCIVRDPLYLDNCTNRVVVNGYAEKKGTFMTGIVVTGCHNFDIGWVSFRGKNWAHSKGSCNVIIRDGSKGLVRCNDFNGCSFAIIVENNSELWVYGNRGSDITHYIGIGAYTTIYGMRSGSDVCPDFTGHYYADAGHVNLYHIHDGANYTKTPSVGWSPSYTPTQKTQTWSFNKIWSDETLRGWSDRQELIQGYASTWNTGRWTGYMQMTDGMTGIRNTISGGTNLSGRIYVQRTSSSGNSTGSKLCLYASDGTLITNSTSINRSQGVWVSLSSSIIQKIQSGAITYFYLKADSNNTATYFKCESNAKIEITYTK